MPAGVADGFHQPLVDGVALGLRRELDEGGRVVGEEQLQRVALQLMAAVVDGGDAGQRPRLVPALELGSSSRLIRIGCAAAVSAAGEVDLLAGLEVKEGAVRVSWPAKRSVGWTQTQARCRRG